MSISLRLLCLLSTTYSGIPTKEFNDLKRQFLHTYGYHHILTFFNLSRVGLLIEDTAGTKSNNMLASTASRYLYKRDMFKVKINSLRITNFYLTLGTVYGLFSGYKSLGFFLR